jgi:hypothetical protein
MKYLIVLQIEQLMNEIQYNNFGYVSDILHISLCLHGRGMIRKQVSQPSGCYIYLITQEDI